VYQLMYDLMEHREPVTGLVMEPFPKRTSPSEVRSSRVYEFRI